MATALPYRIDFENESEATAPAQIVTITDGLDTDLDWSSFALTEIGFGDQLITIPANSQHFETTVPVHFNGQDFEVQLEAGINPAAGQVSASFFSIDPATGLPPDVLTDFLPPEDGTGRGMGHIAYVVNPKSGLATGTQIRNIALISFDGQPWIATNQVDPHDPSKGIDPTKEALNTIDAGAPNSAVQPLAATSPTPDFLVEWAGTDDTGGCGIASYDIYVSTDGGAYALWKDRITATSATFSGQADHSYAFYSIARDNVGNDEAAPATADATTQVVDIPVNTPPVAVDDQATTPEDTSIILNLAANDTDADQDPLSVITVTDPQHGTAAMNVDGSVTYTPSADYFGDDAFTYTVGDGQGGQSDATVTITVSPVNDAPVFELIPAGQVDEGQEYGYQAVASDVEGDALHFSLTGPAGATIDEQTGLIHWLAEDGPLTASFTVVVSDRADANDLDARSAAQSFDVSVANVAPTLTLVAPAVVQEGQPWLLQISAADPGADTVSNWWIDWGDGQQQEVDAAAADVVHVYHISGQATVNVAAHDEDGIWTADPIQIQIKPPLQVVAFAPESSGFGVRFNEAIDPGVLNLYDASGQFGTPDIVVTGAGGAVVSGSFVLDGDSQGLYFVKTGSALAPDTYSVTLRSGANAFHAASGTLDGDGDGTAGGDYHASFTATASSVRLSLPDFMRGPAQPIDVPATGQGLPLTLTSDGSVRQLVFTIRYDTRLLEISAAQLAPGVAGNLATDSRVQGTTAEITLRLDSLSVPAGTQKLLNLVARVPDTAPYASREIIGITGVSVNGLAIDGGDDDALQLVGYFGDANGSARYETDDVKLIQRLAGRMDSGLAAWREVDPLIVADIDGNGRINSIDAGRVLQELSGNDRPEIPPLPAIGKLVTGPLSVTPPPAAPAATGDNSVVVDLNATYQSFAFSAETKKDWLAPFVNRLAARSPANPNLGLKVTLAPTVQATPRVSALI